MKGRPPDGHLEGWVVAPPVVIDAVFMAAADAEDACANDLAKVMKDARRGAPVGQHRGSQAMVPSRS